MHLIKGILASISIFFATLLVYIPFPWWMIKLLWVRGEARRKHRQKMDKIIWWWTDMNRRMIKRLNLSDIEVRWPERDQVSPEQWYLVISNHQSWTDIVLLQSYLYGSIPPLKFFTKAQLIWIPFIGLAMYLLGFPYVKRVTKTQIKANPALRTADRDNVAAACRGFQNHPTSILNFVEGTRRTDEKQKRQRSEYKHLLRPKIGGLGYVLEDMDEHLHKLLDVTIIYPKGVPTFWEFLQGKCEKIIFEVHAHDIPQQVLDAEEAKRRTELAQWIKQLWEAKEDRIEQAISHAS